MSYRFGSSLVPGAYHYGVGGLGVLGQNLAQAGLNGQGYLAQFVTLPADNLKEVSGLITAYPSAGNFVPVEDGSFLFSGAPDGLYSFTFDPKVDGVSQGLTTKYIVIGAYVEGTNLFADITGSGSLTGSSISNITGINLFADITGSGVLSGGGSGLPSIGRPVSDSSNSGWLPSNGSSLFDMINETVADDSNYIFAAGAGSDCVLPLNDTAYPGLSAQGVSYRIKTLAGVRGIVVTLKQGAVVIASWTHANPPTVFTTFTQFLSPVQIALITAGPLSIEFTSL